MLTQPIVKKVCEINSCLTIPNWLDYKFSELRIFFLDNLFSDEI